MTMLASLGLLLLAAAPGAAQTPVPAPSPTSAAPETPAAAGEGTSREQRICRDINTTGSRVGRTERVCLTRREWRDLKRQD